jgi:hypothetical protein
MASSLRPPPPPGYSQAFLYFLFVEIERDAVEPATLLIRELTFRALFMQSFGLD